MNIVNTDNWKQALTHERAIQMHFRGNTHQLQVNHTDRIHVMKCRGINQVTEAIETTEALGPMINKSTDTQWHHGN